MAVIDTGSANFQADVLGVKGKPVIVDFWAPWCGPCQVQGPILDELAEEMADKAVFAKVNVDDHSDLASQYGIMSIPALKIFKDGQLVEEMVGVHDKAQLQETLGKYM